VKYVYNLFIKRVVKSPIKPQNMKLTHYVSANMDNDFTEFNGIPAVQI
jgi:hypothetical protein